MVEPHLVAGLRAQRKEIAAEIARLSSALKHIDAAIRIASERPNRRFVGTATGTKLIQRGSVGRLVFDALRARGELSTTQLGVLVAEKHGLDTGNRKTLAAAVDRVGKAMSYYRKNGHVVGERRGHMTWWRLSAVLSP